VIGVEPFSTLPAGEVLHACVPKHVQLEVALVGEVSTALFANAVAFSLLPLSLDHLIRGQVLPCDVLFLPLGFRGRRLRGDSTSFGATSPGL